MAGLFGILNIGNSAIQANQRALATTGQNIANAQTPGYTRQEVVQQEAPGAADPRGSLPGGVDIQVAQRIIDRFAEREYVAGREASAYADSRSTLLGQVQEVFNETDVQGVGGALNDLFNSFRGLDSTPKDPAARARVRDAANAVAQAFASASQGLKTVRDNIEQSLPTTVADVNSLASQVASLNASIVKAEAAGGPANDLRDQRDEAARQLVEKTGGQILDSGKGYTVLVAGRPLVDGDRAGQLAVQTAAGGSRILALDPSGNATDITQGLTRGTLGATLDVRARTLADLQTRLDTLAYETASRINAVHEAGFGLDGVGGRDLFAPLAGPAGAASQLAVSAAVQASTDAIASSTDATDPGNNSNALALAAVADESRPGLGGQRISGFYAGLSGDAGRAASDADAQKTAQQAHETQAQSLRDQVSGVTTDEEMVQVVQLQGSFQAAAKVVTVVDQLLSSLLNI
jgi:flagellar hook-associated protein 1 FlgK